jgi:hypothetical protein
MEKGINSKALKESWETTMALSVQHKLFVGLLTLALGLLFSRFEHFLFIEIPVFSFLAGIFMDLSIVMNLSYLVLRRLSSLKNSCFSHSALCSIKILFCRRYMVNQKETKFYR